MRPRTRFVIFSSARSGTSLVTATLERHPEIFMHAEIFQKKRENHILKAFRDSHDVDALAAQPRRLARAVLDWTPGPPVVGFKMWTWQAPAVARELLADAGVHKIVIERRNRLAAFSSVRLAFTTGTWNRWPGDGPAPPPPLLPFDAAEFAEFCDEVRHWVGTQTLVTVSIGAVYAPLPADRPRGRRRPAQAVIDELLRIADREMYAAKHTGRDQVSLTWSDILTGPAPEQRPGQSG